MIKRSLPNGRTDVIKAMGNAKWGDMELLSLEVWLHPFTSR